MPSFNSVQLMGNLTRDPELRYTESGTAVCSFGIAVNEKYKKDGDWEEKVHFFDVTVWARQAENCAEYLHKGSLVFLSGKLDFQTWEKEGERKSKVQVVANIVQFLNKKVEEEAHHNRDDIPF